VIKSQHHFLLTRSYILNRPTVNELGVASRLANAIEENDRNNIHDSLVEAKLKNKSKQINNLILHYTHEARLSTYKHDIHQLWNRIITPTPAVNTKLIVGNRNNRSMERTLVHRRPHQHNVR
jgi:hypothetical protein